MDRCLGVTPGSVCAFGLINDIDIASVVLTHDMFMYYLSIWGGECEWLEI